MKLLTIAIVVAMIALLPGYSHALDAPVSVPEPGSFLLLASGLSTLGGLLAGRWYVTKKQAKRPERHEP